MKEESLSWLEQSFNFGPLRLKVILFSLAISLIPLIGAGIIAYNLSQNALSDEAFAQLETIRNLKSNQVQSYFEGVNEDIQLLAEFSEVNLAMTQFERSARLLGTEEIRGGGLLGRSDLLRTERFSLYDLEHARYHPLFTEVINAKDYLDVLLVDLNGNVVYSQAKRDDFATNLLEEPYNNTSLGQVFSEFKDSPEAGEIFMTDYAPYPPVDNAFISFVGTPIIDGKNGPIGMLVYALSLDQISKIVEDKAGLDTVESYLVGPDKMKRSSGMNKPGKTINNEVIKDVFENGVTSAKPIWNGGKTLFTAYQPIEIAGLKWALITEKTEEDALAGARRLQRWMITGIMGVTAVVVIAGFLAGFWIANPISQLTEVARQVTGGNLNIRANAETQDEIGELAETFNTMTAQLRHSFATLEEQVKERTAELALSVEVGQRVTTIRDMDVLLATVTEFIWDQFKLHHVQVFLVDDINQNLVLRASTGQAGQELLTRNFSLPIDANTTAGRSAIERQSIVVGDTSIGNIDAVGHNMPATWYLVLIQKEKEKRPASLLPESLSELAIPLMVEGQVLGVLDLQDNKLKSFTEKDLSVYESIAVQLSISIDSARQWELAQEAQQRAEQAVQQLTREAWAGRLVSSRGNEGFVYDLSKVMPLSNTTTLPDHTTAVSLIVQDQAIGQLMVNSARANLTSDEQALLQSVAQQLAQKAENLRLFEATQQRASREQIARQIIDKVRASRNIEMALRTATEELNKALGTARAVVDLHVPQADFVKDSGFAENITPDEKQSGNGKPVKDTSLDVSFEAGHHLISEDRDDDLRLE